MPLELAQAVTKNRDPAAREPAVGLELGLAGAARADAAAEALEVLPHSTHPRQVVLELGEFDLELSLGGDGVLREDVENQLRPVDDARLHDVLELPLLNRAELVVDEKRLCVRLRERLLQLDQLPLADIRARLGMGPVLDELADRLDARGARELLELAELPLSLDPGCEHGHDEPALGLRARRRIRLP